MEKQMIKDLKRSDILWKKSTTGKFIIPNEEVEVVMDTIGLFIDYRDELLCEIESLKKQLTLAKAGIKL